jgi:hypothetical protein
MLVDPLHLIAKYQSVSIWRVCKKVIWHGKAYTSFRLFYSHDTITTATKVEYSILRVLEINPVYTVLSAESRLVNLHMWRLGGNSAEVDTLHAVCVGRAEHTTHVVHASHVVKHDNHRNLPTVLELVHAHAVKFSYVEFSVQFIIVESLELRV